ncbi:hypothetical protein [Mucilaginibacter gossypii]|uniref:Uncharacterized protein n=1 Tax=Mucilaginibacter gossypii TaxID=551996 RepID=A0A1G8CW59_9SPHI|nr:hypothetical protein [Mucilaginibacter gossypii]SDH49731.1 hypothetical protein SAMN05192573_11057 [Mucilaginibacter gossypii]
MNLSQHNNEGNNYLLLLEALILQKLSDEELVIGTAYRDGNDYAVLSLDEYGQHNVNLHLYCARPDQFLLEIEDFDQDEEHGLFKLSAEDLNIIPEGLRQLMSNVARSGKPTAYRKDQLSP